MKKILLALAMLVSMASAQAQYYQEQPQYPQQPYVQDYTRTYAQPQRVYVAPQPPVVYVQPAPVYVQPAPVYADPVVPFVAGAVLGSLVRGGGGNNHYHYHGYGGGYGPRRHW